MRSLVLCPDCEGWGWVDGRSAASTTLPTPDDIVACSRCGADGVIPNPEIVR